MTDRYGKHPPDEPVIGASYPPSPSRIPPATGSFPSSSTYREDEYAEEEWDEEDDGYSDRYAEDEYPEEYYGATPARQPMFYVFIALAVVVGAAIIFLLYSVFKDSGEEQTTGGTIPAGKLQTLLDSPRNGDRIEIAKVTDVSVRASSSDALARFELFVNDRSVDQVAAEAPVSGTTYSASLKLTFDRKGEYTVYVRAITSAGGFKDSDKIKVIAIEPVGDLPRQVGGRVLATVNLRTGPGENFDQAGTLAPGQEVKILGKSRDGDWLLVDVDGGRWVKRTAIQEEDSLSLVPVREPTPTPAPQPTNTPQPSPTATPSASPTPVNAPDLVPTNAVLIDGGQHLRVTVANIASAAFTGSLVVNVNGVGADPATKAFAVNIPANGSTTLDFDLNPPVTGQKTAQVRVDPDNAIRETNEDNNAATFVLQPAVEPPNLTIANPQISATTVTVTVRNDGGEFKSALVVVRLVLGSATVEVNKTIALAKGQSETFTLARPPGQGEATVTVLVGGQSLASAKITLP